MAITVKYFISSKIIDWKWPLKIAIFTQQENIRQEIRSEKFLNTFTLIDFLELGFDTTKQYNIVLIDNAAHFSSLIDIPFAADLVIVCAKKSVIDNIDQEIFSYIPHPLNTAGIVFLDTEMNFNEFIKEFLVDLWKRDNAIDVLKLLVNDASFYIDPILESESGILSQIRNIQASLRRDPNNNRKYRVDLPNLKSAILKGSQLATVLENVMGLFYENVRQSSIKLLASIINEIVWNLDTSQGSPQKINQQVQSGSELPTLADLIPHRRRKKLSFSKFEFKDVDFNTDLLDRLDKLEKNKLKELKENIDQKFLQAGIKYTADTYLKSNLHPNTEYTAEVFIGKPDQNFGRSKEEFATDSVFEDSNQKKEPILLVFKSNTSKELQSQTIMLPRNSDTIKAKFSFTTTNAKKFIAQIYAYHKNRCIQHIQLEMIIAAVVSTKETLKVKTKLSTRKELSDIESRLGFAATLYLEKERGKERLHGVADEKAYDFYFSDGQMKRAADILGMLEASLIKNKKTPKFTDKDTQQIIIDLAFHGNLLYKDQIEKTIVKDGPLQIVSNNPKYIPIEFVYTLPAPDENATLCKNAQQALIEGKCKGCYDRTLVPAPHVCPFGFWSFSRVIERHNYTNKKSIKADYSIQTEPVEGRNTLQVLQNSMHGSSAKVDKGVAGTRKAISTAVKANSKKFDEADEWANWTTTVVKNSPESIILVVHTEKHPTRNIDQLEIGKTLLLQNYIGSKLLVSHEIDIPRFVVIIGCETSNSVNTGFDIASTFLNEGAAVVVSNFTKIRGRQAKDIIITLLDLLKSNKGKEFTFGEIMLKLRQQLLAQGMVAALTVLAQGDADWKIKL